MTNALLLLAEALVYFSVMAALFRLRHSIGVGLFMSALGVMHFLETYLAAVFYVDLPFGLVSPGSTVLFSGKLVMLLLLYLKEDAATVRQPIYGLFLGNALIVGLVLLLRHHQVAPLPGGAMPDMGFIDQMGWLMVWGTTLLFVDAIMIILLYEKLRTPLGRHPFLRMCVTTCCVLSFDQLGFFAALHLMTGAPWQALFGGWIAKMCASIVFTAMLAAYLRYFEAPDMRQPRRIGDIFQTLTYRERYEALVEESGRDGLTGLLHRGRFEERGERAVADSLRTSKPLSLLVVDVDHFKSINDRLGHAEGDRVLRAIGEALVACAGEGGEVFRIGGEEFALLCPYPHGVARLLGERIRQAVSAVDGKGRPVTVSIGIASVDGGTIDLMDLYTIADRHLYAAKAAGRDRVMGDAVPGARSPEPTEAVLPRSA
jgi:diguanylate cyclase (GGDEF)-like protein